jgi:hypothetical protein
MVTVAKFIFETERKIVVGIGKVVVETREHNRRFAEPEEPAICDRVAECGDQVVRPKLGGKSMGYGRIWVINGSRLYSLMILIFLIYTRSFLMKVRRLDQRRTAITSIRVARVADQSFSYVEIHSPSPRCHTNLMPPQ